MTHEFGLPSHHTVPPTSHIRVLSQVQAISERVSDPKKPAVTAGELGLAGPVERDASLGSGDQELATDATLVKVCAEGPPEFPYIHGHFVRAGGGQEVRVPLHTAVLRHLSEMLGFYGHGWDI